MKKRRWNKPLTISAIELAIIASPPDTKVRERMSTALGVLAKFAGLVVDTSRWRGSYSPNKVSFREVPDDQIIQEIWRNINLELTFRRLVSKEDNIYDREHQKTVESSTAVH